MHIYKVLEILKLRLWRALDQYQIQVVQVNWVVSIYLFILILITKNTIVLVMFFIFNV